MGILSSEVLLRASVDMTDGVNAGGRMGSRIIVNNGKNGVFPDAYSDEMAAGSTKNRKLHWHIAPADDSAGANARVFMAQPSPGDDSIVLVEADHDGLISDLTGSERVYGAGQLNANVLAASLTLDVLTEGAALDYFQDGDLVRISDKVTPGAVAGTTIFRTIDTGGVSYAGDVATLTFTEALGTDFLAADTYVSSVIEWVGTLQGQVTGFTVTSSAGTYDDTNFPPTVSSIGGVYDDWTLEMTDANNFTLTGVNTGLLGTFSTAADLNPANPVFGSTYLLLLSGGWGGTFVAGDQITFTTIPSAVPFIARRIIPAATATLSGNYGLYGIELES